MTERVKTVSDYLQFWRSLVPEDYSEPIEANAGGQGLDPIAGMGAMAAALEAQGELHTQAYYLRPFSLQTGPEAAGEAVSHTSLDGGSDNPIYRAAPAIGEIVIPVGTLYEATQQGTHGQLIVVGEFVQQNQVTVAEGSLRGDGGSVGAVLNANLPGYWGNVTDLDLRFKELGRASVPATVTSTTLLTAVVLAGVTSDTFLRTHVGRYVRVTGLPVVQAPRRVVLYTAGVITIDPPLPVAYVGSSVVVEVEEWADLGLSIPAITARGGVSGYLDAEATARNLGRRELEDDDALRDRLVNLADTISPAAIARIVQGIFSPRRWRIIETQVVSELKGFVFDLDPFDWGKVQAYFPHPSGSEIVGEGAVWLSDAAQKRFFVILVQPTNEGEFGFGYDSPMFPDSNAWDWGFFDGSPVGFDSLVAQVWDQVNQARMGGVGFAIVRDWSL